MCQAAEKSAVPRSCPKHWGGSGFPLSTPSGAAGVRVPVVLNSAGSVPWQSGLVGLGVSVNEKGVASHRESTAAPGSKAEPPSSQHKHVSFSPAPMGAENPLDCPRVVPLSAGSQPADPGQCPAGPVQHPGAHHRAHHDAGHQGGGIGHVPICAQDCCSRHPQAVQVTAPAALASPFLQPFAPQPRQEARTATPDWAPSVPPLCP